MCGENDFSFLSSWRGGSELVTAETLNEDDKEAAGWLSACPAGQSRGRSCVCCWLDLGLEVAHSLGEK